MSPGGTDILQWSGTGTPSALGEIGMDTSTGIPTCYYSGSAQSLSTGSGGGALVFLDKKTLSSDSQYVDFSGLDGNDERVYFGTFSIINRDESSDADYYIRPNGSNTNCVSSLLRWYSTSHSGVNQNSEIQFVDAISPDEYVQGFFYFFAMCSSEEESFARFSMGRAVTDESGSNAYAWAHAGYWSDTSTNLTSLRIYSSSSRGLGTGSEIVLYKLAQS